MSGAKHRGREQGQWIEVGASPLQSPVQARCGAVRTAALQGAHGLPRDNPIPHPDAAQHWLIGGAQRRLAGLGQCHRDNAAASHQTREGDHARLRGAYPLARLGREIHPSVARPPGRRRRLPPADHRGAPRGLTGILLSRRCHWPGGRPAWGVCGLPQRPRGQGCAGTGGAVTCGVNGGRDRVVASTAGLGHGRLRWWD